MTSCVYEKVFPIPSPINVKTLETILEVQESHIRLLSNECFSLRERVAALEQRHSVEEKGRSAIYRTLSSFAGTVLNSQGVIMRQAKGNQEELQSRFESSITETQKSLQLLKDDVKKALFEIKGMLEKNKNIKVDTAPLYDSLKKYVDDSIGDFQRHQEKYVLSSSAELIEDIEEKHKRLIEVTKHALKGLAEEMGEISPELRIMKMELLQLKEEYKNHERQSEATSTDVATTGAVNSLKEWLIEIDRKQAVKTDVDQEISEIRQELGSMKEKVDGLQDMILRRIRAERQAQVY